MLMIFVFIKNPSEMGILENIINDFTILTVARVNWKNSAALAVGEWSEGLLVLPQSLAWRKDGLKYL